MHNVEKLDSTTAKEVMGVWQTPTGCNKRKIEKMQDQLDAYYVLLDNAYIPRHTVCEVSGVFYGHNLSIVFQQSH